MPKITLEDKESNKPRIERTYIPCPHCDTLHDSRTWSTQNNTAFKNWFGLYCNHCGHVIPCLINVFSLLVLTITYPLWGWFKTPLKNHWLKKQPDRFKNIDPTKIANPFAVQGWIKQGISYGLYMFVTMGILFQFMLNGQITLKEILIAIPYWLIVGLLYGYTMKRVINKKGGLV